jgi:hypothetical protein
VTRRAKSFYETTPEIPVYRNVEIIRLEIEVTRLRHEIGEYGKHKSKSANVLGCLAIFFSLLLPLISADFRDFLGIKGHTGIVPEPVENGEAGAEG